MIPVVLSGGNGTRLWPLSRKLFPKQFHNLTGSHSLFQQTLMRLAGTEVSAPVVVANLEHRFIVEKQLQALGCKPARVLLEPTGRNTAPAVALAALDVLHDQGDEILLVLPADHLIQDVPAFHQALHSACQAAEDGKLVLFGIPPNYAETGYGYIQACLDQADRLAAVPVQRFVEKPDQTAARAYVQSGDYFWNSGMFVFRASCYLDALKQHAPEVYSCCEQAWQHSSRDGCLCRPDTEVFAACPSVSVDYAVMEKTDQAYMVPLQAGWTDVGSWSALWQVQDKDEQGNACHGDVLLQDCHNSYVHASHRLVSLVGVDDLVVVETKDAVMVAHKDKAQQVKELVGCLSQQHRPEMDVHTQVYRPWGSYDSVDQGSRFQVKRITVQPGAHLSLQMHHHRAEHWVVVSGTAQVTCGDTTFLLTENQSTYIPVGSVHRLSNPGRIPLEIIEIQSGSYLGEDDIQRLDDYYGRAAQHA